MALKASMKILLVDNVPGMRGATKTMLSQVGFKNVKEVGDGEAAWKAIEEGIASNEKFEFIISEWTLPKMTGLELLRQVRENPAMAKVPFLLVTGDAEQTTIVTAIKAGASNFVVKPFSSQTIQEKIASIFAKQLQPKKKAS